jgi:hypothetical protein
MQNMVDIHNNYLVNKVINDGKDIVTKNTEEKIAKHLSKSFRDQHNHHSSKCVHGVRGNVGHFT